MIIHNLNVDEEIENLNKRFLMVEEINNSLSESRANYRAFAKEIGVNSESLLVCCDDFKKSLLIDFYTFSEQLMKNVFYDMIKIEDNSNSYLDNFIKNKVPKDRFSPNVKFEDIEKMMKEQLFAEFKFLYSKNNHEIKTYDEMVKSRNKYAHKGNYVFDFTKFPVLIDVLKYLYFELSFLIKYGSIKRKKIQDDYINLKKEVKKISRLDAAKCNYQRKYFDEVKKICYDFTTNYGEFIWDVTLLENVSTKIIRVANQDSQKYIKMHQLISDLNVAVW